MLMLPLKHKALTAPYEICPRDFKDLRSSKAYPKLKGAYRSFSKEEATATSSRTFETFEAQSFNGFADFSTRQDGNRSKRKREEEPRTLAHSGASRLQV